MKSFNETQAAIVLSTKKLDIKWLFEIDTDNDGTADYFYSTQNTTFEEQNYDAKILNFKGITFNRNVSEYGLSVPSKLNFSISNVDNLLNGSDFEGASILVRLIAGDGENESELMKWNFKISRSPSVYQKINVEAHDWLQDYLKGDYPNTSLIQNLFPSNDPQKDNVCVPVIWGTAFIPVRSAYITSSRFYVLGPYTDTNFGAEKLTNIGFEIPGVGGDDVFETWEETKGSGTIAEESTIVYGDYSACKMTAGVSDDCIITQDISVTAGKLYKLTIWTRGDGTNAGRYYLYDVSNSTVITAATSTGVTGTSYTKVEIWFTAPYDCSSVRLQLQPPETPGGICYYDDISIKEITDYSITKVKSPREFGSQSAWTSFFKYYRKVGSDGNPYICAEFIIADSDLDGVNDANGLFRNGEKFLDVPCKYSYMSTSGFTNAADLIEYILLDMGIPSTKIDDVSLAVVKSTYTSWSLTLNGGIWFKINKRKFLAKLLTMMHLELIVRDKIYFKIHTKVSQDTIDNSLIIKNNEIGEGTFGVSIINQNEYKDSGFSAYQEEDNCIDSLIKILIPAKTTTNNISSTIIDTDYIQNSQHAQIITKMALQRRLLGDKKIKFDGSTTLIGLEVDDVITINGDNYDSEGSTYNILIDEITLNKDLSISISGTRFSESLDDWEDLSFDSVVIASDDSTGTYQIVVSGPSSVGPTGTTVPNRVPGRLTIGNDTTNIIIDPDKSGDRVIYSGKTDFGTDGSGFIIGVDFSDSNKVKMYLGDSTNYLYWNGTNLIISGDISATTGTVGGFTIAATTLTATNLILDSANQKISLGSGNDIIILDAADGTYRLAIGNSTYADAPFSITKAGAIKAISGTLGGFTLAATTLSADSGSFTLNSSVPSIAFGAASDYLTGIGIWQGKHDSVYKMHMGDPAGDHIKWDGSNLYVTGMFIGSSEIGTTISNTFEINSDNTDTNVQLIFGRTTGGDATIQWNGTNITLDKQTIADNTILTVDQADAADNDFAKFTANGIEGRSYAEVKQDLDLEIGTDLVALSTFNAHKDRHDPNDGADALDTAAAAEISAVVAAGTGTSHSFSRADHIHAINHGITDNHIVTVDHASAADNDYAKFTASGIEGRSYAEVLADLSAQAGATFSFNGQDVSLGSLTIGNGASIGSAGDITLSPTGDILLNPTGNDVYPTNNYDINLGLLTKKFLTLHAAELWVETLVVQDTMATIGGRIIVAPCTELTSDLTDDATTIYVKHNNLANGDRIYLESNGKVEFMAITGAPGGAGPYSHTVTRNLDGSGANVWYAGDAVLNTGTTGDGFIDIYSNRGIKEASDYGPTIVGNVRNSATYSDYTECWAIGNLNGIYGYSTDTYGAAFGKYSAANYITIDSTNGVRFLDADDVIRAQLSSSTWTLGYTTSEHVSISSTAIQFKDGSSVYTDLTAGVLKLGLESGGEYVSISSSGVLGYGNAVKLLEIKSDGIAYLGDQSNEHIKLSTSGLQVYDGATLYATYGATTTIGLTASEHLNITSASVQIKDGSSVYTDLTAGVLKLGLESGGEYVSISSSGVLMYGGAVAHLSLSSAGAFWAGDTSSSERIEWNSSDGLFITNASNVKVFKVNTTGDASLLGSLKLGDGTTTSGTITLSIADGQGDCYIATGKTDFTNTDTGFILGIDDSDSNKAKFFIGNSTDYLNWNGSKLTITLAEADSIVLNAGGNIKLVSVAGDSGKLSLDSGNCVTEIGSEYTGYHYWGPTTDPAVQKASLRIGFNPIAEYYCESVRLETGGTTGAITFYVYNTANSHVQQRMYISSGRPYIEFQVRDLATSKNIEISYDNGVYNPRLIPSEDSEWDLGVTANRWLNLYVDNVTITDTITVGGDAIAKIKTGSYTGDGATSKAITGVGFTPKYVKIWAILVSGAREGPCIETTTEIKARDADGGAYFSDTYVTSGGQYFRDNSIITLGTDGFTVDDAGSDLHPNKNGTTYDYICFG